jgi:nucleoside-diphosphate-sugar epimerase
MEGIRLVYHLVVTHGKTWSEYLRNDVEITRRIGEDCLKAGVGRLVYTGTIDSYYNGRAGETITEETPLDPKLDRRNKYARAKAAGERALMELHRDRGLPVVIARPALVVGRGGSPFHVGVAKWPYESLCQLWGEGNHPLPFVLVEDLAAALVAAGRAPGIDGQAFNLSGPHLLSAREYAAELGRAAGARFRVLPSRAWKFYAGDLLKWAVKQAVRHPERPFPSYRDWDSRSQRARYDCSKAARLLGWKPTGDRADLIRRGIDEPAAEFLG